MRSVQLFRVVISVSILFAFSTMAFGQFNCLSDGTIALSPGSISFSNAGGSGGFSVSVTQTCGFNVYTFQNWIHPSPSGLSIPFTVDANGDFCSRAGSIVAQITQNGSNGASASGGVNQGGVSQGTGGDFSLSVSPSAQTIHQGQSASYTVTVARSGAFTGSVGFSASGMPSGVTASFSNFTYSSATMTLTAAGNAALGSFTITVTGINTVNGVNCGQSRSASITLTVAPGIGKGITTAVNPIANTMDVDYIGTDAHVHQFYYNGTWHETDLSAATGAPAASTSGPGITTIYNSLGNGMEVHYIGADQHVHTLWSQSPGTWYHADISGMAGAPAAALNSSITASMDPIANTEDVEYIGTDQHVHELWYNGTWNTTDITVASGAAANADSSSGINTLMNTIANAMEVHYIGTDHHTYSLWYPLGGGGAWHAVDHTLNDGAPLAQAGSPLTSASDTIAGTEDMEYVNTSQHVQQLWYNGFWHPTDLTVASGAANLASNGGMHTLVNTIANTMEVHYVGTDQHVYALWYNGNWYSADLTITTGAPAAVAASPLTSSADTVGNTIDIEYVGTDQHIHQLWYNGSWHTTDLTAIAP